MLVVQGEQHAVVAPRYPEHNFTQKLDHLGDTKGTFQQRFWYDAKFYKPGGPVIVLDGGETSGAGRLPFLATGILNILAKELDGLGIVLEHRFYVRRSPFEPRERADEGAGQIHAV